MNLKKTLNTSLAIENAYNEKYKKTNKTINDYVDLMRMAGSLRDRALFSRLEEQSPATNHKVFRELGKFYLLIEGDHDKARHFLNQAIKKNPSEPLWVYYFSDYQASYYTQLSDGYYFTAIPKNGSTTFKSVFLEKIQKTNSINPHQHFDNPFFKLPQHSAEELEQSTRILVTRDPVKRFFSYYKKNILEKGSLEQEYGVAPSSDGGNVDILGLSSRPDAEEFCKNFWSYCYIFNDVFHHLLPQDAYIDTNRRYDYQSDIGELDSLVKDVLSRKGIMLEENVKRRMVSSAAKKDHVASAASQKTARFARSLYADDYTILDQLYGRDRQARTYSAPLKSFCPSW